MDGRTTARIHLLPAREAPIVVIIRRKPSKVFHVMRWNTETDAIEHGSWFRGKLYPLRCDVSFDGDWMVYLALGAGENTWNGVCRLPWLKTACEAENNGTYDGGGYWADRRTLLTNDWSGISSGEKLPFKLSSMSTVYRGDEGVLYPRMERDGWMRTGPAGKDGALEGTMKRATIPGDDGGWEHQPSPKHPLLRCFYRGYLQHGRTFEFRLDGHPGLLDPSVDWANWDALGQLVVARSGGIEKYTLSDLAKGKTTFSRSFEDLEPPLHPLEEKRREHWPRFESPLLQRIADAFDRRWKAIHNTTTLCTFERNIDEDASERLDVQANISEEMPAKVHLSVWDDSALWLGIQPSGKQGRRSGLEFHGNVRSLSHEEIVARFEATISGESTRSESESASEEIEALWDKAALRRKKLKRKEIDGP